MYLEFLAKSKVIVFTSSVIITLFVAFSGSYKRRGDITRKHRFPLKFFIENLSMNLFIGFFPEIKYNSVVRRVHETKKNIRLVFLARPNRIKMIKIKRFNVKERRMVILPSLV